MSIIRTAMTVLTALALSACVTTPDPTATVTTWRGWDVAGMLPPLEVVAASNRAQAEGRVAFRYVEPAAVATACHASAQGCTVRRGQNYTVFVASDLPDWMQQLVATHESGHVGQYERGLPTDHAGYVDPTIGLIRRLGG